MKSTYVISQTYAELDGGEFDRSRRKARLILDKSTNRLVRLVPMANGNWDTDDAPGRFYLAGPMRGYPMFNFPAFLIAARVLNARGIRVASPAEKDMEAGFDPSRPLEGQNFDMDAAFRWDFSQVVECVGTILLPGWEKSTGAKAERLVAKLSGREVYLLTEDFRLVEAPPMDYELTWKEKAQECVAMNVSQIRPLVVGVDFPVDG